MNLSQNNSIYIQRVQTEYTVETPKSQHKLYLPCKKFATNLQKLIDNIQLRLLCSGWAHLEGFYKRNKIKKPLRKNKAQQIQGEEIFSQFSYVKELRIQTLQRKKSLAQIKLNRSFNKEEQKYLVRSFSGRDDNINRLKKFEILNEIAQKLNKNAAKSKEHQSNVDNESHIHKRLTKIEEYLLRIKKSRQHQIIPTNIIRKQKRTLNDSSQEPKANVVKQRGGRVQLQKNNILKTMQDQFCSLRTQLNKIRQINSKILRYSSINNHISLANFNQNSLKHSKHQSFLKFDQETQTESIYNIPSQIENNQKSKNSEISFANYTKIQYVNRLLDNQSSIKLYSLPKQLTISKSNQKDSFKLHLKQNVTAKPLIRFNHNLEVQKKYI